MNQAKRDVVTPRLGRIQWAGPAVVALLTLVVALAQEPLFSGPRDSNGQGDAGLGYAIMLPLWTSLVYVPFLGVMLAAFVGAFRAIAASSRRREFAALVSLGAPRRELIRHQDRLGWHDGVRASLGGTALGLGITQAQAGFGGEFTSNTLWAVAVTSGVAIVATVVAYGVVARWAVPRGLTANGIPALRPHADAASLARGPRRRRWIGWIIAASVVVASLLIVAFAGGTNPTSGVTTAIFVCATLILMIAIPTGIVWAGALAANRLSTLAGGALLRGGVAARIAGDGLTRPTPARSVAVGAVGLVLGATAFMGLIANPMAARNSAGGALTAPVVVSTAEYRGSDNTARPGWEDDAIDASLLAALSADDRLVVVPGALLTSSVAPEDMADGSTDAATESYLAVYPGDLDRVSHGAASALYFEGPTALGGAPFSGILTVGESHARVDTPSVAAPFSGVPRDWAESVFGTAPTSVVLIYNGADGSKATDVIDGYDLPGLHVYVSDRAGDVSGGLDPATTLIISGTLLTIAVGLVVALSLSAAKTRGHDYATLAALGATRGALRWGTALESAVLSGTGAVVGVAVGSGFGLASSLNGDRAPRRLLGDAIRFDLAHAPWLVLAVLTVGAVLLAAGASVAARSRVENLSPAEQLREATKQGAS